MRRLASVRSQVRSNPRYTITTAQETTSMPLASSIRLPHKALSAAAKPDCTTRSPCTAAPNKTRNTNTFSAAPLRKSGSFAAIHAVYRCSAQDASENTNTRVARLLCEAQAANHSKYAAASSSQSVNAGTRHSWRP